MRAHVLVPGKAADVGFDPGRLLTFQVRLGFLD